MFQAGRMEPTPQAQCESATKTVESMLLPSRRQLNIYLSKKSATTSKLLIYVRLTIRKRLEPYWPPSHPNFQFMGTELTSKILYFPSKDMNQ